jgi:putative flippase GtrA
MRSSGKWKMSVFIKIQAASVAGSLADYLITIILVEGFNCWYLMANGIGNITGITVQFILLRNWVFKEQKNKIQYQIMRYILVFAGNLILSGLGIYLFTHFLLLNYLISKTVTSILLGISYNYFMQKRFVFNI